MALAPSAPPATGIVWWTGSASPGSWADEANWLGGQPDVRTPDGFDEKRAREIAERDWDQDRRVDDNARKHRAMGVVDLRRFELSLLQLADAWADARTGIAVKKAARDAREAGRRVGPVCRNVAVATTLWNLLEAVSVVDDDDVRVWRWRFYREPLVKKKKKQFYMF